MVSFQDDDLAGSCLKEHTHMHPEGQWPQERGPALTFRKQGRGMTMATCHTTEGRISGARASNVRSKGQQPVTLNSFQNVQIVRTADAILTFSLCRLGKFTHQVPDLLYRRVRNLLVYLKPHRARTQRGNSSSAGAP